MITKRSLGMQIFTSDIRITSDFMVTSDLKVTSDNIKVTSD